MAPRRALVLQGLLATTAATAAALTSAADPVPAQVLAAMDAADSYFTGHNAAGDCGWTRGTYFAGAIDHYESTCAGASGCNATLLAYITSWAEGHNYSCAGSINANDEACGATYAQLYRLAPAPNKLNLRFTLDKQVESNSTSDWNWVDALFMGLPTFMRFANATGEEAYAHKAYQLYLFTAYFDGNAGLWSEQYGLFYRDATYFGKTCPNGMPVFWARGNGWAFAAMARSIAALPVGHPYAAEFKLKLVTMAKSLQAIQGADGLWRASLLDANEDPNPETTGSALFAYGLAWGVRHGILDRATYAPTIALAWAGLSTISQQADGMVGWCQPANGQPAPTTANSTSDFCVGQFLLAGHEVALLFSA